MTGFLDGLDKALTVIMKANQRLPLKVEVAPDVWDDLQARTTLVQSDSKMPTAFGLEIVVNALLPKGQWRFPDEQPLFNIRT